MNRGERPFVPGTLLERAERQSDRARESGALEPCATTQGTIADGSVQFLIHRAESFSRKTGGDPDRTESSEKSNPFIDYDRDLFVAIISRTHICLLNKFPVIPNHLLIVTRVRERQESLLNHDDFAALFRCLEEVDGLGFYNGGRLAGASQGHKHLQLAPLPLAREGPALPMEALIASAARDRLADAVPGAPFRHALAWRDSETGNGPGVAAAHRIYLDMLEALFPAPETPDWKRQGVQPGPYNLLVTRRWMMLVPRSADQFAGIPVNALGYAGSFFIWTDEQWNTVQTYGPMTVLAAVALPRAEP